MDLSSFSNFYDRNSEEIEGLALNLLGNFIKKDDPKPKNVIVPAPQIQQVSASPSTDKTMLWIVGGVGAILIVSLIAFRR